ncbi:unnamed protein product [Amoebophrya sp. A25]|nr:unnamed protein product [Amoebophrya sp. A25]|eukprot:GSA25T00003352001.1
MMTMRGTNMSSRQGTALIMIKLTSESSHLALKSGSSIGSWASNDH